MIEYGNLCSEEFALYKEGRIPNEIWKIWRQGIKENFETAIWREAWHLVAVEYQSYRSFYAMPSWKPLSKKQRLPKRGPHRRCAETASYGPS
jgi:hypothetical protein